jgi:predicted unusual protein kinase regulating ubiquinone biosynthesis (AarF/ABC1/UbiB family)
VKDPERASAQLFSQPFKWLGRNVQIFVPITLFAAQVLGDIALNREEENRPLRANQLLDIISAQSPALIKAGQVGASSSSSIAQNPP